MSGHRRRKGHAEEHHVDERWLVSYADMITVLMALFIVLYALSTVNQKKFDELKNSLASGFGVTKTAKVDETTGIVPKKYVKKHGKGFSSTTLTAAAEAAEVKSFLARAGAKAVVSAGRNTVTISLVGSAAYFGGNQADLRPEAISVLHAIAPVMKAHVGKVSIEGHASPEGSAGTYGSDWNLAGQRANSVLFYLIRHDLTKPKDISSISYGSENAVGTTPEQQQKNRRVDIVLHQSAASLAKTDAEAAAGTATTDVSAAATTDTAAKSAPGASAKATPTSTPTSTPTPSATAHGGAAASHH